MSVKAFVLIETEVGKTKEAYSALQKMNATKNVDAVTGPYDIVITIEGDDINAIGTLVAGKIHAIPGILRTVTCLSLKVK